MSDRDSTIHQRGIVDRFQPNGIIEAAQKEAQWGCACTCVMLMTFYSPRRRSRVSPSRLLFFAFLLFAALFLSGCVRYNVGLNFKSQHGGAIVQQIELGEQLSRFNPAEANEWLNSLERRARKLGGRTQTLSDRQLLLTIPFNNGEDLVKKFNQFFNPTLKTSTATGTATSGLVQPQAQMQLKQSNWLLFERDRLKLTVDLRDLGVSSQEGPLIVTPESLVNLELSLNAPWGARNLSGKTEGTPPPAHQVGNQLVWELQAGELNVLEAAFWLPSYLAWGTLAIALVVAAGFTLKYKRLPLSDR